MKTLLLLLVIPLLSFIPSDIDYTTIPENRIAVIAGDADNLQLLAVDKARFSSGSNLSKLSFKGVETSVQFKKEDGLQIFARGGSNGQRMTFSIVRLEVDEKKRFAAYNSVTGKKIKIIPCLVKEIDSRNKIYKVTPNSKLEVGVYAFIFKIVSGGNFMMSMGPRLLTNPSVFEIVE